MKERYANIDNPTIAAVVHALTRYSHEKDAKVQLAVLGKQFIVAKKQLKRSHPSVHLWIKGYGISAEDMEEGMVGQFALISYEKRGEYYVLFATKIPADISEHPQRAQIKRDNPNWGHPVLRSVRKCKVYAQAEEAFAELELLHKAFPRVSIPNPGKLYIMIYCADRPAKQRMVKHVLEVKPVDFGFLVTCRENIRKAPLPKVSEPKETKGYFTAKLKKKPPTKPKNN